MSELARTYEPRAYRYTLRPQENCFVRFAGPNHTPWEEGTEIRNISVTGLAFTTPEELCPIIGEMIKVEFVVPPATQMACYAQVVRIAKARSHTQIVGIRFAHLTAAHNFVLQNGLSVSMRRRRSETRMLRLAKITEPFRNRRTLAIAWALTLMLLVASLYAFSLGF